MMTESSATLGEESGTLEVPLTSHPLFSRVPDASIMWRRSLLIIWVILAYGMLEAVFVVMMKYWYLQSFGLESIFWTNFAMGATAWVVTLVVFAGVVIAPAYAHAIPKWARMVTINVGLMFGLVAGYYVALEYTEFLLLRHGESFGKTDPIFGNDISFYAFTLPSLWIVWAAAVWCMTLGVISALRCATLDEHGRSRFGQLNWFSGTIRRMATPCSLAYLSVTGVVAASAFWLMRYDVLFAENDRVRIPNGAAKLDVAGVFSTLNGYWIAIVASLGITAAVVYSLSVMRRYEGTISPEGRRQLKRAGIAVVSLVLLDLGFNVGNLVQQSVFVTPNEPLAQLPYIKHHIDNTMEAYGLDEVEDIQFLPKEEGDPLPDVEQLLQKAALRNVSLWPGYVAYLESYIDPQHAKRVLQTQGDTMIYGPTKEVFRQQQKLRMYYDFISVDTVRYKVEDEKKLFVSSVRELPLYDPQPWLYHWGRRTLWYTHGHGLVAAWASQVSGEGEPVYAVQNIPSETSIPELTAEHQGVYFGEGSYGMFLSNPRGIQELDHPTDDDLVVSDFPKDSKSGVLMDSFLKRAVLGWCSAEVAYTRSFWEFLVSGMITPETKCHFWRSPIDRLSQIAPFLFYDSNEYAVVVDGRIVWMVNALTSTNQYPYSQRRPLGDKATIRTRYPRLHVMANYIRDSVKCTVDATTGEVQFYKFGDEPIVNTWEKIYPDLFTDAKEMPQGVRDHLQYPLQFFHRQFDDIYKRYHMRDPLVYFNMEDLWDDADEVLGPVFDKGEAITFSFEPYHWITNTGDGVFPASSEETQFAMAMPFTNEKAFNLRAIPMVYQDGADYGKLFCLHVPKGKYRMGPEQADAAIDQEPTISEQISWWNRLGNDVIRGHTNVLIADGELIYVEPVFIRSQQEPYSQLKQICVVLRGHARMGHTLEEALRLAVEASSPTSKPAPTLSASGGEGD